MSTNTYLFPQIRRKRNTDEEIRDARKNKRQKMSGATSMSYTYTSCARSIVRPVAQSASKCVIHGDPNICQMYDCSGIKQHQVNSYMTPPSTVCTYIK